MKDKTFLDEAERKYGRKETWHMHPDPQVRMQLVRILKSYIDRTLHLANERFVKAEKAEAKLGQAKSLFRTRVHAALANPQVLRAWAQSVQEDVRGATKPSSARDDDEESSSVNHPGSARRISSDIRDERSVDSAAEERRRRGEAAVLDGSVAVADEPFRAPYSEFPFLRQRALEGAGTLDASLVDWTAKHFPTDNAKTFAAPPVPRASGGEEDDDKIADTPPSVAQANLTHSKDRRHSRHSLTVPLDEVIGTQDVVADQSGVFYKVKPFAEHEEEVHGDRPLRAPKKARSGYVGPVRKVDWETVETARKTAKTPDVHRARERLFRITRGEDPSGVQ